MGICYSQEQQWQAYHKDIREKRRNRKKKKTASIIYQQNSVYENSFASKVQNSFRQDIFESIQHMAYQSGSILTGGSIAIGSLLQMKQQQIKIVYESLTKINPLGQLHNLQQPVTLCNMKYNNFLHTHKISFPNLPKLHQVSCCPSNSNHIIEYDIWKFIKINSQSQEPQYQQDSQTNQSHHQNQQSYLIYHPFTQRFLNFKKGQIVCSQQKQQWKIISFGPRRNGGFVKIVCEEGQLCMTDERGLLTNHRRLGLCKSTHISHMWQLRFGEIGEDN